MNSTSNCHGPIKIKNRGNNGRKGENSMSYDQRVHRVGVEI